MAEAVYLEGSKWRPSAISRDALMNPCPIRLSGALAPGTIAQNTTAKERVHAAGVTTLYVVVKNSNVNGQTHTIAIYPMMSDATSDDTVGTRHPLNNSGAANIANTTAVEDSYTTKGEEFFEIEIDTHASAALVITYVEVYGI